MISDSTQASINQNKNRSSSISWNTNISTNHFNIYPEHIEELNTSNNSYINEDICCQNNIYNKELMLYIDEHIDDEDIDSLWTNQLKINHIINDIVLSAFEVYDIKKMTPYIENSLYRYGRSKSCDDFIYKSLLNDDEFELSNTSIYNDNIDYNSPYSVLINGLSIYGDLSNTSENGPVICHTDSSENSFYTQDESSIYNIEESTLKTNLNLISQKIPVVLSVVDPSKINASVIKYDKVKRKKYKNNKKYSVNKIESNSIDDNHISNSINIIPLNENDRTTVMLRNIPNKYTQQMLLEVINHQFNQLYDFFYLPIDFRNKCNVGYAFINFIKPEYAAKFKKEFEGFKLIGFKSSKICKVSWGRVQGLEANIQHYKNSAVMSLSNLQHKPMILKKGIPINFPVADYPLPEIKLRPQKKIKSWSIKR